jgi:hypothetical protein
MKIRVHDVAKEAAEDMKIEADEFDTEKLGLPVRNVGRLYKAFADGSINCTFENAVERHRVIEQMYSENGIQE